MTEKEKIIKLIRQLKAESKRYLNYLKTQSPHDEFDRMIRKEYDTRVMAFRELLGMLESSKPIEEFLDEE